MENYQVDPVNIETPPQNRVVSQKKHWLIFILVLFLILSVAAFFLYINLSKNKKVPVVSNQTVNEGTGNLVKDEFPDIPEQTGAVVSDNTKKPNPALEQFYALMDKAPISTENFVIEADYDKIKLVVTIKPPFNLNLQRFSNWLEENGYGRISQEDIIYKQ